MSWITEYWKEQFEKGKLKGKNLKKEHKDKIKKLLKKENENGEGEN